MGAGVEDAYSYAHESVPEMQLLSIEASSDALGEAQIETPGASGAGEAASAEKVFLYLQVCRCLVRTAAEHSVL